MKKNSLIISMIAMAAIMVGCSEENVINRTPATEGDEIIFGARGSFEDGNNETRTIYGDKGDGFQVINWVEGDLVRIACAQSAQAKEADYAVSDITQGSTTDPASKAAVLTKQGVGLQWGTGEHTFYAVYPSPAYFTVEQASQPHTTISGSTVTGVVPVVQTAKEVKTNAQANGETYDYIFEPNMDYAYMAARAIYNPAEAGGEGVTLNFKPLVTAIEVEFNISDINVNTADNTLQLTSIGLRSEGGQPLSGAFSANISSLNTDTEVISGATVTNTNEAGVAHNQITLDLNNQNVVLGKGGKCLMTFFIHPSANFDENNEDMKLFVSYTVGGTNTTRTYKIGKEVKAHKKYFFNNITLPAITSETNASTWFSMLADNIYVSQLSIPGAGNAASAGYNGSNQNWYKEQTLGLVELWNLGVRCFEFVSDRDANGSNLGQQPLKCNDASVGVTFNEALNTLTGLLSANPRECLVIICNYQPSAERNNQDYMNDFNSTYGTQSAINGCGVVKLDAYSTVGDIRGKVAFIGRISQEGEDASNTLEDVPSFFTYIQGWGSLKDKWNRRFGDDYYPGYDQANNMGTRQNVEDLLWSVNRANSTLSYPTSAPNFLYSTADGGHAWVQEWMRVVPEGGLAHSLASSRWRNTLYINWPGSYDEKYNNIVTTFDRAKAETGNVLYINSLCGYYVTDAVQTSYFPYIQSRTVTFNGVRYSHDAFGGGGNGGDFATYNNAMNARVYDYVHAQSLANTTGPMGIVMMDYLGNGTAGVGLPSLILQNNFKFALRVDETRSTSAASTASAQGWE